MHYLRSSLKMGSSFLLMFYVYNYLLIKVLQDKITNIKKRHILKR